MSLSYAAPLTATPTINLALIGPPKTGKTTAAASAPGPILYLNADLPTSTRFARRLRGEEMRELTIPVDGDGIVQPLRVMIDITHEVMGKTEFKTVVIDPVGELYRLLLEEQSRRSLKPTLPTYGDVGVHLERFCRAMCEAPVNAIFVFHDMPEKDEASGEIIVQPFAGTSNPRLGRKVLGMVDIVAFSGVEYVEKVPHYMGQLVANKGRPGGDRFGVLADERGLRELNLAEWIETITKAENGNQPTSEKGKVK